MSEDSYVVCSNCYYPRVELFDIHGNPCGTYFMDAGPFTEEEALKMGWTEPEYGILCPDCSESVSFERAEAADTRIVNALAWGTMGGKETVMKKWAKEHKEALALANQVKEIDAETGEILVRDREAFYEEQKKPLDDCEAFEMEREEFFAAVKKKLT